jgi:hypothetical protein
MNEGVFWERSAFYAEWVPEKTAKVAAAEVADSQAVAVAAVL